MGVFRRETFGGFISGRARLIGAATPGVQLPTLRSVAAGHARSRVVISFPGQCIAHKSQSSVAWTNLALQTSVR